MTSVAVIGASGYTGAELVRLVLLHPRLSLKGVYARRAAGQKLAASFPQFAGRLDLTFQPYSAEAVDAEVAFLPLLPLLDRKLIAPEGIVVDAKSGVSGAGRNPGPAYHYPEVEGGVRAYKVGEHRHTPEIEQELGVGAITFIPHLLPMSRGILA